MIGPCGWFLGTVKWACKRTLGGKRINKGPCMFFTVFSLVFFFASFLLSSSCSLEEKQSLILGSKGNKLLSCLSNPFFQRGISNIHVQKLMPLSATWNHKGVAVFPTWGFPTYYVEYIRKRCREVCSFILGKTKDKHVTLVRCLVICAMMVSC